MKAQDSRAVGIPVGAGATIVLLWVSVVEPPPGSVTLTAASEPAGNPVTATANADGSARYTAFTFTGAAEGTVIS